MRKKVWGLVGVLVGVMFLMGCSSNQPSSAINYPTLPVDKFSLYDGSDFRIQYPIGWEKIEGAEVFERFRSSAKLVLVSNKKDAFFTPNIIVEQVELSQDQVSKRLVDLYNDLKLENDKNLLLSDEVSRTEFTTIVRGSAANGLLVQLKGKRRLETDVLTYVIALLKDEGGKQVVIATGAYDELDLKNQASELIDALRTLAIK